VDEADLSLPDFWHGIAEVVVRCDSEDFDTFPVRKPAAVPALRLRPVERVGVRALAVELDAVVTEITGGLDEFGQGERFTAIPSSRGK